ncbi:hypothetical protein DPMN_023755 [Dreissena polymorpha]|uniref:Uncharacterized protein n=1 Tax=Dreissena polymorpha TaxID=45954 RepID=A0A9D4LNJ6_DREPO|nr:hypothetical protein DPMN_023755 [Dreissena polymorpha]
MLTHNRKEPLMELLCYGADCNIGDSNGDTPLHVAVQVGDCNIGDSNGDTLLYVTVQIGVEGDSNRDISLHVAANEW